MQCVDGGGPLSPIVRDQRVEPTSYRVTSHQGLVVRVVESLCVCVCVRVCVCVCVLCVDWLCE